LLFFFANNSLILFPFLLWDRLYLLGNGSEIESVKPGLAIEALWLLEKTLDVKFKLIREPWKRCHLSLGSGKVDGLFYASFKPERMKLGVYPMKDGELNTRKRFMSISYVLYTLRDSAIQWDGKNLKNVNGRVGAAIGYSIVDDLRKRGIQVDESRGTLNDFRKLALKRLAAVAALEMNGDFYLRKNPDLAKKIVKISPALATKDYYLVFSHPFFEKHSEVAEEIWNLLAEIRESEKFTKKVDRYF